MKTVYLVRHAKSSWDYPDLPDYERPLNDRGLRDAPFMSRLMQEKGVHPDALISSPAVRALTTAIFFKNALGLDGEDILIRDVIYEAMSSQVVHLIQTLPEDFRTVMVFGHNPTFTSVANLYANKYIDNIPTCGIVRLDAEVEHWPDFGEKKVSVSEFHYPKQYL